MHTHPRATRREWIGLAVIALPCLLYSLDLTVLNLAIPALSADLKPTSSQLLWIVDIYGFMVAGLLITMGTLGDRIGRRRLLLIGAAAFGVASVLAAFASSAAMLIATRALLGIAGATLAPSTLSLIRNMFHDPEQRTVAIGIWGTSFAAGGAVGPLVGGLLLQYFWWGSVFLLAVPVMVLLLALGPLLLPEFRDPKAGRLDLTSALLSLASVLTLIYGLKHLAEHGASWISAAFVAAGLIGGWLFVRRQRSLADPLLDLRLFANRAFCAALLTNVLGVFVAFGGFLFIAQYLQLVLGLSPLEAGLWSLPGTAMVIISSNVGPVLMRRIAPATMAGIGLFLGAVGYALLTQVGGSSGLAFVVVGNMVMSAGFGLIFIVTSDLILSSAPPARAGAASALSETGSELGGALGIAVLGSLGTAIYRMGMAGVALNTVAPEAVQAARDTLGGAVALAHQLPEPLRSQLLTSAHRAFVQGFQMTAFIATVVLIATALMAFTFLRTAQPAPVPAEAPTEGLATGAAVE